MRSLSKPLILCRYGFKLAVILAILVPAPRSTQIGLDQLSYIVPPTMKEYVETHMNPEVSIFAELFSICLHGDARTNSTKNAEGLSTGRYKCYHDETDLQAVQLP
jgi:hypothetical protein